MSESRWWVIEESELLAALERAAGGNDPVVAMAELTANCEAMGTGPEGGR